MNLVRLPDGSYLNPSQVVTVTRAEGKKNSVLSLSDGELLEVPGSPYDVAMMLEGEYDFPEPEPHTLDEVVAGIVNK